MTSRGMFCVLLVLLPVASTTATADGRRQLPLNHTLVVSVEGGGHVVKNPHLTSYLPGSVVTLMAIPDPGWRFQDWTGDTIGTANPIAVTMSSDRVVTARFVLDTPSVTVLEPNGGEVLMAGTTTSLRWSATDDVGVTSVDLMISRDGVNGEYLPIATGIPNSGEYEWTVSGPGGSNVWWKAVARDASGLTGEDVSDSAFTVRDGYALSVAVAGGGTVTKDPDLDAYPAGTEVQLTAVPDQDWTFAGWSGDTTANENPITVSMDADRVITASFRLPAFLAAGSQFSSYESVMPPAWGDYNQDGFMDLTLYRSNGDGTFSEIPGFREQVQNGNYHGAAWCDYDRDGDVDVALLPYEGEEAAPGGPTVASPEVIVSGRLRLLHNDGGQFVDMAPMLEMNKVGFGETAVWGDFDADGWPDLFAPFYAHVSPHQSFLFHNNGNGTFSEVSVAAGVALADVPENFKPEGAHAVDFDDDGDLDLYCASHLFLNDGTGIFTDVRAQVGLPAVFDEGAMFVDYDNDGDFDLNLRTVAGPELYRNDAGSFTNVTAMAGLPELGLNWGDSWADVDNDGDLDLYAMVPAWQPGCLMMNQGDGTFARDTTHKVLDSSGLGAWADYDRDGDLDLHLEAWDRHILKNTRNQRPGFTGSNLRVLVLDERGTRTQFGATVRLRRMDGSSGSVQTRAVDGGSGYLTQSEYTLHFGTSPEGTYSLEVSFPSRPDSRVIVGPGQVPWLGELSPLALTGMDLVIRRDGIAFLEPQRTPVDVKRSDTGRPPLLSPPAPNPSFGLTTLRFRLEGEQGVSLTIHDIAGRLVRRAQLGQVGPGDHEWQWDGRDDRGQVAPTGVYLSRLVLADGQSAEQRIVKLR